MLLIGPLFQNVLFTVTNPHRDSSTGRPSHVPPASGGSGVSFGAVALDLPDLSPGITFELMTRGLVAELRREFGEGQKRDAAEGTVVEVEVRVGAEKGMESWRRAASICNVICRCTTDTSDCPC